MKFFIMLLALMGIVIEIQAQDLQEIELKLSATVSEWQQATSALDKASIELSKLSGEHEEVVQAAAWLKQNLENRNENGNKEAVKRTKKAYKKGKKDLKRIEKKMLNKRSEVAELTDFVEKIKQEMNRLSFKKDAFINGEEYDNGTMVFSGYFPQSTSFYYPSEKDNLFFNPPKLNCETLFDGPDPYTRKHRIDLSESVLFTLHPAGIPLIDDSPYMKCLSSFSLMEGGNFFLNLDFIIHTKNPRKSFGYLERKSQVLITFTNGEELVLLNNTLNLGSFNKQKGTGRFRGVYPLNVHAQNRIKKLSVDNILVEWAKGYEIYPIYDTDLLSRQFDCL